MRCVFTFISVYIFHPKSLFPPSCRSGSLWHELTSVLICVDNIPSGQCNWSKTQRQNGNKC